MVGNLVENVQALLDFSTLGQRMAVSGVKGNSKARLRIYNKLSSLAKTGVPLPRALEAIWNIASKRGKDKSDPIAVAMQAWLAVINNGGTIADAMDGWIPDGELMLIQSAGSGGLDVALDNAAKSLKASQAMVGAIVGGISYPGVMFLAVCGVLWLFGVQVIPSFAQVKPMNEWTGMAGQMGFMSVAIQKYSLPIMFVFFAFFTVIGFSLPRWTGKIRSMMDYKVPPYSFYTLFIGSGFLLSLASMMKSGVPIPEALRSMRRNATPWFLERLDAALYQVNEGQQIGDALYMTGYGFPDPELIEDMRLYAQLGNFDDRMEEMAETWITEGVKRVEGQAQALNLGMMGLLGLAIAWMGLGIIALMDTITSSF